MYPRFSETFIVNELLALERAGVQVDLFSLRSPVDSRFHSSLAQIQAEVTYLPVASKAVDLWTVLAQCRPWLPELGDHLDELFDANATDAVQAVRLAAIVRERGIGHLHAHFASVATTVARLAALIADVPYTFTAHAKDIFHRDVDPADLRRKLADASAVVTVSDFNLAHLRRTFGPAAQQVRRIYNGLDLEQFAFTPPTDRPPVVVGVGRLVEKKGFTDLLTAAARLVRSGRELRVDLVGTGALLDPLRQQAHHLGIDEHVRFLGAQPQHRVREIVVGASALAAPCVIGADGNRDGLPTVLLEAMALGTPCVATPVTGIPEAVSNGHSGLLVPEGDPAALAAALGQLLDDATLRTRLAAGARTLVETNFDVHHQTALLRRLFSGAPVEHRTPVSEAVA